MSERMPSSLRRGQIVLVSFDPSVGSEVRKTRPAIVVSNNTANDVATRVVSSTITVVPVTSNVARVLPFQVRLRAADTGLDRDSKARAEQIRTISTSHVVRPVGWVPTELMAALDEALRVHLDL